MVDSILIGLHVRVFFSVAFYDSLGDLRILIGEFRIFLRSDEKIALV